VRIAINKIAHEIGMQNQYLGLAISQGKVEGKVVDGGDYHHDNSWVDTDSLRAYLKFRLDHGVFDIHHYQLYLTNLERVEKENA
jgi:hypothetical protein